jgi:hypothetical protein
MAKERWGTFAVADHTRRNPFVADVLLYDRLVVPTPADAAERTRWTKKLWAPGRLDETLAVLGDRAIPVAWDEHMREVFRTRAAAAKAVDQDANFGVTRQLLADDFLPKAGPGVVPVRVVAAYGSAAAYEKEHSADTKPATGGSKSLTLALSHKFLVPRRDGMSELKLLEKVVTLASKPGFKEKRNRMYEWQEKVIAEGISDEKALELMEEHVKAYNAAVREADTKMYEKFAWTLVPLALTLVGGPLGLLAGAGALASVVRFARFDRHPAVQAGDNEPAAMFHTVRKDLGWAPANH